MPPRLLFDLQGKRVFVAGHKGLTGSALLRRLGREDCEILTVESTPLVRTARRASCSMCRDFTRSAGVPIHLCVKGWPQPTPIFFQAAASGQSNRLGRQAAPRSSTVSLGPSSNIRTNGARHDQRPDPAKPCRPRAIMAAHRHTI